MISQSLTEDGTTTAFRAPTGPGIVRIRFGTAGGTCKLQQSIDDVDANFEDCEKPDGEVFSTTTTKSYEARGRLFYRMVGSGGVTDAHIEYHSLSDAG